MIESTNRKYETLPEVKKRREEEERKKQWKEDLKNRQYKVKELDQVS